MAVDDAVPLLLFGSGVVVVTESSRDSCECVCGSVGAVICSAGGGVCGLMALCAELAG